MLTEDFHNDFDFENNKFVSDFDRDDEWKMFKDNYNEPINYSKDGEDQC
jgi:hypothetical protein